MKTAFIYSGQARTLAYLVENHWFYVLRKFPNVEIFASLADDPDVAPGIEALNRLAVPIHTEIVQQPMLPEPPPDPKWLPGYRPSSSPQAILRQLWALDRAWAFYRSDPTRIHDVFVRIRPDLHFQRFEIPWLPKMWEGIFPWWSRWGGVNDRFAVMSPQVAQVYFTTFQRVGDLMQFGCPFHPETLLHTSLRESSPYIEIRPTLCAEFRTLRKDGTLVGMDPSVSDIVDYVRSGKQP